MCQNYNFKGRKECNRCKKPKTMQDSIGKPSHTVKAQGERTPLKLQKNKKTQKIKAIMAENTKQITGETGNTQENIFDSPVKLSVSKQMVADGNYQQQCIQKKNDVRAGDWICQRCNNHNFSFRQKCNMCHLSHELSNMMLSIYRSNRVTKHPKQVKIGHP